MPRWRGCMPALPARICRASRSNANRNDASRNRPERTRGQSMPRFAANLSMMFNEVPFLDRFDAAAKAGFKAVAWAAEFFAPHGLDGVIEPINPRNVPGYFLNDFLFARDLIVELKIPNLKLQFDIYHCQIIHGDVTMRLREMMPIVGHVQIASIPSRNEPDGEELNYPFLFAELDRLGYGGFVGCEYNPRGKTTDGLGWFKSYAGVKP